MHHKEGNASGPSHYRLISVIPCLGKLLDQVVHTQVYAYLTKVEYFSECQMGFRKKESTGICFIDFLDKIFRGMDQGCPSGVLFLDLSKAFDSVNFEILLSKLKNAGFKLSCEKWFRSNLCGRSQVTQIGKVNSSSLRVICDVPRGSILRSIIVYNIH